MHWSVEMIEKNLLSGKIEILDFSPDDAVAAINRAEKILGEEWIKSQTSAKGIIPTMNVISVGLRLTAVADLEHADHLTERVRLGEAGAYSELTAVHIFRSCDAIVDLYPAVGNRVADFRVRKDSSQWITVEVTQPNISQEEERVRHILKRFVDALGEMDFEFALEIVLYREPAESEIASLASHLPDFCKLGGLQHATLVDGMGFLVLNHVQIGHLQLCDPPELAHTPMIGVTMFAGGGAGPGPLYQVSAQIPFTDGRAKSFLSKETKQLPENDAGLVMIEISGSHNHVRAWDSLVRRCFQPNVYTRVSGVCLFSGEWARTPSGSHWLPHTNLVVNPNAYSPLPGWVKDALTKSYVADSL